METNVNYTAVGAFVILLFAFIVLAIIWLSAGFSTLQYTTYKVYMKEAVTGLSIDSSVEYNGVNVGSVSSIKIDLKNPHFVELLLRIQADTPITAGTRAKLNVRTLSGTAYMLLEDKGDDMTPLKALPDEPYPIIATEPSLFLRLDTALTQLNDNFRKMTNSVQGLLSEKNLHLIQELLSTTQGAMLQLQSQTIPATNQAAVDLSELINSLSNLTQEIEQNPAMLIRGKGQPVLGPGER